MGADEVRIVRSTLGKKYALLATFAGSRFETQAEGGIVITDDGSDFLDVGSYAVNLLGHKNPVVVQAAVRQLERGTFSSRTLLNMETVSFLGKLGNRFSSAGLERVWQGTTGAEAVEFALRLARAGTGRNEVLSVRNCFHGKTLGTQQLRSTRRGINFQLDLTSDSALEAVCENLEHFACFIFEPIQGEAGVVELGRDNLRKLCSEVRRHGGLVIADEIQCGLTRSGPMSLALEWGVDVDAVLLGKPLGGGVMPVSAVVANSSFFAAFDSDPFVYTSTFGLHPLSSSVASASLDAISQIEQSSQLIRREFGQVLSKSFEAIAEDFPSIRGRELFYGVEARDTERASIMFQAMFDSGLLVSPCVSSPATIRFLPPAVADADWLADFCSRMNRAVDQYFATTTSKH